MVGVPGRSNACLTCRERRIKCDASKPHCTRCTRNGHICRGYARPRIFVNQFTPDDLQTASSQTLRSKQWKIYVESRAPRPLPGQIDSIPACPSPKVHEREQLLARFIRSFCPDGIQLLKESERLHHYWVQVLPSLGGRSSVVDAATMSLVSAFLGQMEGDVRLQKQAVSLYGNALHELSTITSVPGFSADDHTLASIMCLGMSEVYSPPMTQGHGWVSHNKGGGDLLQMRGLSILNSELGRGLFLRFRVTGLYTAIGTRKSFSFANPALRTVSKVANENYYDFLIEEMVDIPKLLEDIGGLFTYDDAAVGREHAQRLLLRALIIKRRLDEWLSSFRLVHPYPYTWTLSTGHVSPAYARPDIFHPQSLQFVNLLAAQATIHYWAAIIIILRCVMVCRDALVRIAHSSRPCDRDDHCNSEGIEAFGGESIPFEPRAMALRFADCICYSMEYFISKDKGAAGPIALLFPLWVAKDLYSNQGDEVSHMKEAFCVETFRGIMKRGMHFSKALIDLSTKD